MAEALAIDTPCWPRSKLLRNFRWQGTLARLVAAPWASVGRNKRRALRHSSAFARHVPSPCDSGERAQDSILTLVGVRGLPQTAPHPNPLHRRYCALRDQSAIANWLRQWFAISIPRQNQTRSKSRMCSSSRMRPAQRPGLPISRSCSPMQRSLGEPLAPSR